MNEYNDPVLEAALRVVDTRKKLLATRRIHEREKGLSFLDVQRALEAYRRAKIYQMIVDKYGDKMPPMCLDTLVEFKRRIKVAQEKRTTSRKEMESLLRAEPPVVWHFAVSEDGQACNYGTEVSPEVRSKYDQKRNEQLLDIFKILQSAEQEYTAVYQAIEFLLKEDTQTFIDMKEENYD